MYHIFKLSRRSLQNYIMFLSLQSSDCQVGVVFDGLESMFASNITSCTNALLRAINNRKYIFAVTLKLNKERLNMIEEKKKEKAGIVDQPFGFLASKATFIELYYYYQFLYRLISIEYS